MFTVLDELAVLEGKESQSHSVMKEMNAITYEAYKN
jgi:hypothetical protein